MAYPTAQDLRVQYWQGQIGFVQKKVKPLFEACNVLVNQFYNEASTEREQDVGDAEEEHVRRVKSGLIHGFIDQSLARVDERCALDAFLFPYGVAKIGFELDVDVVEQEMRQEMTVLDMEDPTEENVFLKGGIAVKVSDGQDHLIHIELHQAELKFLLQDIEDSDLRALVKESFMDHIKLHKLFHHLNQQLKLLLDLNIPHKSPNL